MRVIRRRFTLRILLLALVFGTLLFAALNFQRPALMWAAYGVLVFAAYGASLHVWLFRSGRLTWLWTSPAHVFAGQRLTLSGEWQGAGAVPFISWDVPGLEVFPHAWSAPAPGLLELPAFRGVTEYPAGLVRVAIELPPHPDVWVYPAPVNHLDHSYSKPTQQGDDQILRPYQAGDRRNRVLLKTQSLPVIQWVTRDQQRLSDWQPSIVLSWFDLPADWSSKKKLEQLAYAVQVMPSQQAFKLTLPTTTTSSGMGSAHQHLAWRQLSIVWQSQKA